MATGDKYNNIASAHLHDIGVDGIGRVLHDVTADLSLLYSGLVVSPKVDDTRSSPFMIHTNMLRLVQHFGMRGVGIVHPPGGFHNLNHRHQIHNISKALKLVINT